MNTTASLLSESVPSLRSNVLWLTRLRWAAIGGQTVTILVAWGTLGVHLRLGALAVIIAIETLVNVLSSVLYRRGQEFSSRAVAILLTFDLVALTGLLHFAGGSSNPFNFLYLVHVVLATVLVGARVAWVLIAISAVLFGALFLPSILGGTRQDHAMMRWHLEGMWIAFLIAAALIVYFMERILSAVEAQKRELAEARERARRAEMLSSLATLATGAAHELATPLSTIAVISQEFIHHLADDPRAASELLEDAKLLREQVRRCQEIIDQMAAGAGQSIGETPTDVEIGEFLHHVLTATSRPERVVVELPEVMSTATARIPHRGLARAIRAVLDNALDASTETQSVLLRVEGADGRLRVTVQDEGPGIPQELLPRVIEPFFSTKPTGRGMGLGLFLADNILREIGGTFRLERGPDGRGTRAQLEFPVTDEAIHAGPPGTRLRAENPSR